jgi:hypothetical protein
MQQIDMWTPDVHRFTLVNPNGGTQVYENAAARKVFLLHTTGYTGSKPTTRPLPVHAYHLNR